MTEKEKSELNKLSLLWAMRKATPRQVRRCMDLEQKQRLEQKEK